MTQTTTKKEKSVGHIHNMMIKTRYPAMDLENMEIKKLNLIVGMNGSGKSFLLVTSWVFGYVSSVIILTRAVDEALRGMVQFAVDHCYDVKDLTGEMGCVFDSGAEIHLRLSEGMVESVTYSGFEDATQPTPTRFMSSAMRTFESISMYLKFRKMTNNNTEELLKTFKLYDLMQVESMIARMPVKVTPMLIDEFGKFDLFKNGEPGEIGVDLDHGDFYALMKDGKRRWLSDYSKGEQSMINIILANAF